MNQNIVSFALAKNISTKQVQVCSINIVHSQNIIILYVLILIKKN